MNFSSGDHKNLPHRKIHKTFTRSKHGKKLKSQVRFSPFKPLNITNQEWEKILGRDVNNLHHMPFTVSLTRKFIQKCEVPPQIWKQEISELARFNSDEKINLILAAQVHDWAEAIIGDIPAPLKTHEQESQEIIILKKLVSELLTGPRKSLATQVHYAVDEVIGKRESKLGMAFDAIERMGYYKVSLRAWRTRVNHSGEVKESLISLAIGPKSPIKREHEKLKKYATIYPPIFEFLYNPLNARIINQILSAEISH